MMQRVDFYILPDNDPLDRFVCQLAGKAFQSGSKLFIQTDDTATAARLDDLLWTYHDISFIPHQVLDPRSTPDTPILIGTADAEPPVDFDVLLNLGSDLPVKLDRYQRILEIVGGDVERIQLARERYRSYRSQGCELHDHKIGHENG